MKALDLRKPIGFLFLLLGAMLAVYGAVAPSTIPGVSVPLDVNVAWGLLMVLFGCCLLVFPWMGRLIAFLHPGQGRRH